MKQVIVMRTDLGMSTGKMVAQGAHASSSTLLLMPLYPVKVEWVEDGMKKVVLQAGTQAAIIALRNKATEAKIPFYIVKDAGLTEVEAGTITCIAIGPADDAEIDKITGALKLL